MLTKNGPFYQDKNLPHQATLQIKLRMYRKQSKTNYLDHNKALEWVIRQVASIKFNVIDSTDQFSPSQEQSRTLHVWGFLNKVANPVKLNVNTINMHIKSSSTMLILGMKGNMMREIEHSKKCREKEWINVKTCAWINSENKCPSTQKKKIINK